MPIIRTGRSFIVERGLAHYLVKLDRTQYQIFRKDDLQGSFIGEVDSLLSFRRVVGDEGMQAATSR